MGVTPNYKKPYSTTPFTNCMIKISIVDQRIETALHAAFPKPPNAAKKHLNKYVSVLENMLEQSELRGFTYKTKFPSYQISLHQFELDTPRMGSQKKRLYAWLNENKMQLFDVIKLGTKTGSNNGPSIVKASTAIDIAFVDDRVDPKVAFDKLHPNFHLLSDHEIATDYDCCEVDVHSLENYLQFFINKKAHTKLNNKERSAYVQAMRIISAAKEKNNLYYQKKKLSPFGRTYYEGLSVQNINKKTREAMLGDSFEYDMRSSVVAWKLGYAQMYINSKKKLLGSTVQSVFPECHQYWIDKSILINEIQAHVFTGNHHYSNDKQIKLIKQAITALNFGAKRSAGIYFDKEGELHQKAINQIFTDKEECDRFLSFPRVIAFVDEQKLLNKTIMNWVKPNQPQLLNKGFLLNVKDKLKPLKTLAYLYQHEETRVMDIVRAHAKTHGLIILANVHDAIVFKEQLESHVKQTIHDDIHTQTNNSYWFLNETPLKRTN